MAGFWDIMYQSPQYRLQSYANATSRESVENQYKEAEQQIQMQQQQYAAQQQSAQLAAGGLANLVNEYNQSYAQAKGEYEQRYQQMLGIAQNTTGQQAEDVRSQYAQQSANGMQNLQRLGLGNTTVGNTLNLGIQNQQSQALNRLADQMQQTQLGIIGGKKTDAELAPDNSAILAALKQAQQTSGVYGGSITAALSGLGFGGNSVAGQEMAYGYALPKGPSA